jgi:hypothetical protein
MIERQLLKQILKRLSDKKAVILLGPRQVGKSTLLQLMSNALPKPIAWWDGDESDIRAMLQQPTSAKLKTFIGNNKTVVIDEAQRIENIGVCLKLITDKLKDVKVIATGSSSFELANKINEPLTGRKWQYNLYPLSFGEMVRHTSLIEEQRLLEHRLIYGYYPEIVISETEKDIRLKELADSYLYKDILIWGRIQKPDRLEKLVQALAFQVGQMYSNYELGQVCGLNSETVESYIQLLEKAFIVFRLPAYNRNQRNELKKSYKIYFYDNGIRNAVINQFASVNMRNDVGQLWENWFISERIKYLNNLQFKATSFFWRTTAQQEVDYIESVNGELSAYECKWSIKAKGKITKAFINAYPEASTQVVTPDNAFEFLLEREV